MPYEHVPHTGLHPIHAALGIDFWSPIGGKDTVALEVAGSHDDEDLEAVSLKHKPLGSDSQSVIESH